MYTKLEEYYMIVFRKSLKSYRANNYHVLPKEFKTYEGAERFLNTSMELIKTLPVISDCKEAIIIKCTNEPINTFKL